VLAKRLTLLHELVPKAVRIAALLNPANPAWELALQEVQEAARIIGLQIYVLKATRGAKSMRSLLLWMAVRIRAKMAER